MASEVAVGNQRTKKLVTAKNESGDWIRIVYNTYYYYKYETFERERAEGAQRKPR
jgi:hypothetical protein